MFFGGVGRENDSKLTVIRNAACFSCISKDNFVEGEWIRRSGAYES